MNLNEAYKLILNEWNVQHKDEISKGIGTMKKVFPLKSNPNYIVKQVTDKVYLDYLNDEVEFAKRFPDFFAKIVKVNLEKGYIIQERLDTKSFKIELKKIFDDLLTWGVSSENMDDENIVGFIFRVLGRYDRWGRKSGPLADLYDGKNEFVNNLERFFAAVPYGDFNDNNFGLDEYGNIKLLDI